MASRKNGAARRPAPATRGALQDLGLAAVTTLAVSVVGLLLLTAAMTVPNDRIVSRLDAAFADEYLGPEYTANQLGGIHNWWSECVGLSMGIDGRTSSDPLRRALTSNTLYNCERTQRGVAALSAGDHLPEESTAYFRYWHGYAVVTRPGVALLGLPGTWWLTGAVLAGCLGGLWWALGRRAGLVAAFILLAPLAGTTNVVSIPMEATQAIPLAAALVGGALVVVAAARSRSLLAVAATAAGGLVAFTDRLTVSALAWAWVVFLAGVGAWLDTNSLRSTAGAQARAALLWAAGFVGVWIIKFASAAVALGTDETLSNLQKAIEFRVSGAYESVQQSIGHATLANLGFWLGTFPSASVAFLAVIVAAAASVFTWSRLGRHHLSNAAALLAIPALIVPVWYELLRNHSQLHNWFTYRQLAGALGIVAASFAVVWLNGRPKRSSVQGGAVGHQQAER